MSVIDFHAHIYPDTLEALVSKLKSAPGPLQNLAPAAEKRMEQLQMLRRAGRKLLNPVARAIHKVQPEIRHVPEAIRIGLEEMSSLVTVPSLLLEATAEDLVEAMDANGVDRTVVIAHPPLTGNDFVLEAAASNPRFIPAVYIPRGTDKPAHALHDCVERGAKILKIHPSADGEGPDSPRYKALVKAADKLGIPVILHTGCISLHLLYRDPNQGDAESFRAWFRRYPNVTFVLAHMNFNAPQAAIDLAIEFPNVYVDTSWQPAEVIGEAVGRAGARKVLFGTDWPLAGDNISVGRARIRDAVASGLMTEDDAALVLGANAERILAPKAAAPKKEGVDAR